MKIKKKVSVEITVDDLNTKHCGIESKCQFDLGWDYCVQFDDRRKKNFKDEFIRLEKCRKMFGPEVWKLKEGKK